MLINKLVTLPFFNALMCYCFEQLSENRQIALLHIHKNSQQPSNPGFHKRKMDSTKQCVTRETLLTWFGMEGMSRHLLCPCLGAFRLHDKAVTC